MSMPVNQQQPQDMANQSYFFLSLLKHYYWNNSGENLLSHNTMRKKIKGKRGFWRYSLVYVWWVSLLSRALLLQEKASTLMEKVTLECQELRDSRYSTSEKILIIISLCPSPSIFFSSSCPLTLPFPLNPFLTLLSLLHRHSYFFYLPHFILKHLLHYKKPH